MICLGRRIVGLFAMYKRVGAGKSQVVGAAVFNDLSRIVQEAPSRRQADLRSVTVTALLFWGFNMSTV
jgi:hypothetical protein